jgi:DNA-binding LacI/PurR family transcriptional regulator
MSNATKYAEIAKQLNQDIVKGKYDQRLPNNIELAKAYKTTPITIRKSLKLLEKSGIIKIQRTRGGTIISDKELSRREMISVAFLASEAQNRMSNAYFQKIFVSIQEYFNKNGGVCMQIENLPSNKADRKKALARIKGIFDQGYYRGFLITNDFSDEEIKEFIDEKIPLVILGGKNEKYNNIPYVKHHDDLLRKMIISEVKRLGIKKVAIISKPLSSKKSVKNRSSLQQIITILKSQGYLKPENIRFIEGNGDFQETSEAVMELIANDPDIELFITYGSNISRGCYMELSVNPEFTDRNFKLLPVTDEDIIGSFPNLLIPVNQIGETAAELLLKATSGSPIEEMNHRFAPYWRNHPDDNKGV